MAIGFLTLPPQVHATIMEFWKEKWEFWGERGPFPSTLMVGLLDEEVGGLLEFLPFVIIVIKEYIGEKLFLKNMNM